MVFLLLLLRKEGEKNNKMNWIQMLFNLMLLVNLFHVFPSHSVFAPLLHDVLGVLQHLLLPQVKEVGGISVKLQGLLPVIPVDNHLQPL